ncbi:MAG: type IV pilus twitching motility protein PilT [Legionellales bacterium]|nr:type IV pilus twitching motility protein PilT [Legionellales bacterium]
MSINELLAFSVKNNASDLHLSSGMPPMIRVDGDLHKVNLPPLDSKVVRELLFETMTGQQQKIYEVSHELDFSYELEGVARFRVNAFQQQRGAAGVFRTIPNKVASFEELGLPAVIPEMVNRRNGLILVTGPTGSGKSTSLAAMIHMINQARYEHIITIEDPIEFIHHSDKCLINQREVGRDTFSFANALRAALREDPNIILVGEMRDPETIHLALTAAETGHLVFATLHTNSAAKTINRIIDAFPGGEKEMVRSMLSESLYGVISQALVKRTNGGRIAATEIMICTSAIRNLIREDKIPQIYSAIQTSQSLGMHTMDMCLRDLAAANIIAKTSAHEFAANKDSFK